MKVVPSKARDLRFAAKCRSLALPGMTNSGELRIEERDLTFATGCQRTLFTK